MNEYKLGCGLVADRYICKTPHTSLTHIWLIMLHLTTTMIVSLYDKPTRGRYKPVTFLRNLC